MNQRLTGIVCIAVLCVILTLGLWPFHAPKNDVVWLKEHNGLRFGDYGTVISSGPLQVTGSSDETSCSIEIWLQAARADEGGTILAFYTPHQSNPFSLHQSVSDLMLQRGTGRAARIYLDDLFYRPQPLFVTITSGAQYTTVYVNGNLARTAPSFRLTASDCAGRLILGNAPLQQDSWSGQVRGLAIYYGQLSVSTVREHYIRWVRNGQPAVAQNDHCVGLYLFDERNGRLVHDHAGFDLDLVIPETYMVLDKISLEPFWQEFNMSWGFWRGILKNIVGFIPVGFCFYAYFSMARYSARAMLITVVAGFALSLTIEVLQAYLPTRDSGTTDLITNTLGTYVGILIYRALAVRLGLSAAAGRKSSPAPRPSQ